MAGTANAGETLAWKLVLPGDPDYDSLRTRWNAAFNGYPAMIVRCLDADDVIAAITFARELGMAVSVRSGGHSIAGYDTNYNGMVIDLSPMKSITIDPEQHIAHRTRSHLWRGNQRAPAIWTGVDLW